MQTNIFAIWSVRTGRLFLSLSEAVLLLLVSVTPALAQGAPASRSGSVLNILLLAGIAYFLIRAFRRRSGNDKPRPGQWSKPDSGNENVPDREAGKDAGEAKRPEPKVMDRHEAARQLWDSLSSEGAGKTVQGPVATPSATSTPSTTEVTPANRIEGFEEAEFLEGAKLFFSRFQQAIGEQDFQDIRDFMSDEMYAEVMTGRDHERIEVMLLSAKLMEMHSEDKRTLVSVYYDAQLRVGDAGRPVNLRTVWEFSRDEGVPNGLWVLEKINSIDQ